MGCLGDKRELTAHTGQKTQADALPPPAREDGLRVWGGECPSPPPRVGQMPPELLPAGRNVHGVHLTHGVPPTNPGFPEFFLIK